VKSFLRWVRGTSGTQTLLHARTDAWYRATCAALFLVLFLIGLQCAKLGMAGLRVEFGQQEMDHWTSSRRPYGIAEIDRIAKYFNDSLNHVADHPWGLEGLGALDLARMRLSTSPKAARAYTQDAYQRFRRALYQRPSSPFLWANLALSKLYLDEVDAEFFAALRYANELGPWEPSAQQTVLFAGLAAWDKLDHGLQQQIMAVLERGASRNAGKMFEIARNFRRFDLVCGNKSYDLIGAVDCRNATKAARSAQSDKSDVPAKKGSR